VAAFDNDHTGGPITGLPIMMHWKSGFSSDWNRQCIFVLASDFLAEHTSCDATLDNLQEIFVRKLQRTRREWILAQTMQPEEGSRLQAEAAKKNRRKGRLHGVRLYIWRFCWLLMNIRRRPIIAAAASLTSITIITPRSGVRSRMYTTRLDSTA